MARAKRVKELLSGGVRHVPKVAAASVDLPPQVSRDRYVLSQRHRCGEAPAAATPLESSAPCSSLMMHLRERHEDIFRKGPGAALEVPQLDSVRRFPAVKASHAESCRHARLDARQCGLL
jgi:hypothetical protein